MVSGFFYSPAVIKADDFVAKFTSLVRARD